MGLFIITVLPEHEVGDKVLFSWGRRVTAGWREREELEGASLAGKQ